MSLIVLLSFISCTPDSNLNQPFNDAQAKKELNQAIQTHIDAITNKDLAALKSTLSPNGKMMLMLPRTDLLTSTENYIELHSKWLSNPNWSYEAKILSTEVGPKLGFAVAQVTYREPERDGEPYFNRMLISYTLEKFENKWYIISHHTSSSEKSTDVYES